MKKKYLIGFILTFFLTVTMLTATEAPKAIAAPLIQKANFTTGYVNTAHLNVRDGTSTRFRIVCVLKKGDKVLIFGKAGNWLTVYCENDGYIGAVHKNFISNTVIKPDTAKTMPIKQKTPKP